MEHETEYVDFIFRDKNLDLSAPRIMGILNSTPDSFSDGGLFISVNSALDRIGEMIEEGADIIDIGGESTRPGSDAVSVSEELGRVIPILEQAIPTYRNCLFSIDTTKFEVAEAALDCGVQIINDVSGLVKEPRLAELAARYKAGYVLMHSQGDPKTMQENPVYDDVIGDISAWLDRKLKLLISAGVNSIVLDPGIGFGKTLSHNLSIISKLNTFTEFGCPVLVGASRKSMIGQLLDNREADDRLIGTIAVHYQCMINGARILRVHDVKEAKDSIRIYNAVKTA